MQPYTFKLLESKAILKSRGRLCETSEELLTSDSLRRFLAVVLRDLAGRRSRLIGVFGDREIDDEAIDLLIQALVYLTKLDAHLIPGILPGAEVLLRDRMLLNDLVEYFYNAWRTYDRFVVVHDPSGDSLDRRPYRTFHDTVEQLTHLVRGTYRDVQESLTGEHPRVFRQVRAGAEVAAIASSAHPLQLGPPYDKLQPIPIIRQVLLNPPLVLNPPMNKRTGQFRRVQDNPLHAFEIVPDEWMCYPAKVGELLILVYIHQHFFELGFSLCNLFELASDADLARQPDAIYTYGVPAGALNYLGPLPTVFHDDEEQEMLVAAVPNEDRFGYFGYLKKMVLTLHNIRVMKLGHLPFHGALLHVVLEGRAATVLIIGDTGAGKSETIEAFRVLGSDLIQDMTIIADDMGSIATGQHGEALGYGTEVGAFVRLDDLQPGFAFGQIDRAIFMSPSQTNARVVLPVTTYADVVRGYPIDMVLYANNYETVDEDHPVIERFPDTHAALPVFEVGQVMSKGTTTTQGLTGSYFANIFGPPQYRGLHEQLASRYFARFFARGIFVGQIRTRLGLPGWETRGPEEAARALVAAIKQM
jgi:hypothetical protein